MPERKNAAHKIKRKTERERLGGKNGRKQDNKRAEGDGVSKSATGKKKAIQIKIIREGETKRLMQEHFVS